MNVNKDYLELARVLKGSLGPDIGFALWMRLEDGNFHYASSAQREDVLKMLEEWLARAGVVNARDQTEPPAHARARTKLEKNCVDLGHMLESYGHDLVLMMFNFGDRGSIAWYSNVCARSIIEAFRKAAAAC